MFRQKPDREAERAVRKAALAVFRAARRAGMPADGAASRLGLLPHTLSTWSARWKTDRLRPEVRGRPEKAPSRSVRRELVEIFTMLGPEVRVSLLEDLFPGVSRRELMRHRDLWLARTRRKKAVLMYSLRFPRAGSVWAVDFAKAPTPIDGRFPEFLPVRDLATGRHLAALPAEAEDGGTVRNLLAALFAEHGPPLVLKADNGGAFRAGETHDFLDATGVELLHSPPYLPSYNGAAETGVGSLRTHAHYESARRDRPGEWTCDDLEAARLRGNEIGHPFGRTGLTPDEAWARRRPVTAEERMAFREECARNREREKAARGHLPLLPLSYDDRASIDRTAISKALIDLEYLIIRRRRVSRPISSKFRAKITA